MRVLMTGGGTGGHVNPAIAIADTIKQNDPTAEIAFVGTPRGIENKLVPAAGYKLYHVDVRGIRRSLSPANIRAAWLALTSPIKAKKLIREFRPDLVVGTGGYVSWPVVKAAAGMGIATALHESNAAPGMTVKMLSGAVDRIYLNFSSAGNAIREKDKLMTVGCPMKSVGASVPKSEARRRLGIPDSVSCVILSFGGSLGAEKVNDAVFTLMERFSGGREGVWHTHATGSIEKDIAAGWFKERGLDRYSNLEISEYIYDMPLRMAAADIVICRSGAMTVSELALMGKCAVFIPSPNVTDDQQYKNAKALADGGAAVIIRENAETGATLCKTVERLYSSPEVRRDMEEKIKKFASPNANRDIYNDLVRLVKSKESKKSKERK